MSRKSDRLSGSYRPAPRDIYSRRQRAEHELDEMEKKTQIVKEAMHAVQEMAEAAGFTLIGNQATIMSGALLGEKVELRRGRKY